MEFGRWFGDQSGIGLFASNVGMENGHNVGQISWASEFDIFLDGPSIAQGNIKIEILTFPFKGIGGQCWTWRSGHCKLIWMEVNSKIQLWFLEINQFLTGKFKVWNIYTGKQLCCNRNVNYDREAVAIFNITIAPDGSTVCIADSLGCMGIYGVNQIGMNRPHEQFFSTDYRWMMELLN